MQIVRIELTGLSPETTDRLIRLLHQWITEESSDIRLEIFDTDNRCIELPDKGGLIFRMPLDRIHYVLSDRHWTIFNLGETSKRFRINFSEAASLLPESEFLNCSRGVILNMNYILKAQQDGFLMDDGTSFPVRRNGRKELLLQFEQFRLWKKS